MKNLAPWETYADEVVGKDTPEMEKAVAEYALRRHEKSSSESEEELARWKEGNWNIAKEYRFLDPAEYADLGPRIGRILSYSEFINILRGKCNLLCFYREMGHDQKLALWIQKNGLTEPELACWVQRPYMTEFECVRFDDKGVPVDTSHRGWRSCLLQMRLKEMLTEEKITKVFGLAYGPASGRYNAMLQSVRQNYGL